MSNVDGINIESVFSNPDKFTNFELNALNTLSKNPDLLANCDKNSLLKLKSDLQDEVNSYRLRSSNNTILALASKVISKIDSLTSGGYDNLDNYQQSSNKNVSNNLIQNVIVNEDINYSYNSDSADTRSIKMFGTETWNDNVPTVGVGKNWAGDDQWKSYSFSGNVVFGPASDNYKLKADASAYTDGTIINERNGNKFFQKSGDNITDVANIQLLKQTYHYQNDKGDETNLWLGGGVQYKGNLGLKEVKNKWHEFTNAYENTAEYGGDKGLYATVGAERDVKKYISGNKGDGIYYNIDGEANIALNSGGVSNINTRATLGAEYNRVNIYGGVGVETSFGGKGSKAIEFGTGTSAYFNVGASVDISKNLTAFVDVKKDISDLKNRGGNDSSSGVFGVRYNF